MTGQDNEYGTGQTEHVTRVAREQLAAERRMPPHPRGVVELLRRAGHTVVVREKARNAGLAYKLDDERERTAFQLTHRARKLGVLR
jgi:alanine dehydrogenase